MLQSSKPTIPPLMALQTKPFSKRSKTMDKRYYWIQDRIEQGQFNISWAPGDTHLGDYFTKKHSPSYHKRLCPFYLHIQADPMVRHNTKHPVLLGCVNLCTTSQTENSNLPILGPHPCNFTGEPMQVILPTLRPPFSSTGQSNKGSTVMLKGRIAATPRYSALRVSTMSDSQIQKTVASRCSAVRTHATPYGHTPAPGYDAGHTWTTVVSMMYHHLFPRSCLS
jgi:hypothetical protein